MQIKSSSVFPGEQVRYILVDSPTVTIKESAGLLLTDDTSQLIFTRLLFGNDADRLVWHVSHTIIQPCSDWSEQRGLGSEATPCKRKVELVAVANEI